MSQSSCNCKDCDVSGNLDFDLEQTSHKAESCSNPNDDVLPACSNNKNSINILQTKFSSDSTCSTSKKDVPHGQRSPELEQQVHTNLGRAPDTRLVDVFCPKLANVQPPTTRPTLEATVTPTNRIFPTSPTPPATPPTPTVPATFNNPASSAIPIILNTPNTSTVPSTLKNPTVPSTITITPTSSVPVTPTSSDSFTHTTSTVSATSVIQPPLANPTTRTSPKSINPATIRIPYTCTPTTPTTPVPATHSSIPAIPTSLAAQVPYTHGIKAPMLSCGNCAFRTALFQDMALHLKMVHDGNGSFDCEYCACKSIQAVELGAHVYSAHGNKVVMLSCRNCAYRTMMFHDLALHLQMVHGSMCSFDCGYCGCGSIQAADLAAHMNTTHGIHAPALSCRTCAYRTVLFREMAHHFQTIHGSNSSFECGYCGCKSVRAADLGTHVYYAHGKVAPTLNCGNCTYRTKLFRDMAIHLKVMHNNQGSFDCQYCGWGMILAGFLPAHLCNAHGIVEPANKLYQQMRATNQAVPPEHFQDAGQQRT